MNVLTTYYMRLEAEALVKEGNDETADTLEQAADIIDRMSADNQRLRDYIDLCAEKFGMEMPNDPTDTGLFAALHPEGDGE